jgi:TrmH family RNA methyltransferase
MIVNPAALAQATTSSRSEPVTTGRWKIDPTEAAGFTIMAADSSGENLDALADAGALSTKIAWVMGNEAWGLPSEQIALVDRTVRIPMWGQAESLNLSTAAAVCLYATASSQNKTGVELLKGGR